MGNKFCRLNDCLNKVKAPVTNLKNKFLTKGFSKKQTIIISSILILCLVVLLIPTQKAESPLASISQIETAVYSSDEATVNKLVNIENISKSMATSILNKIEHQKFTADLLSYMQKELENKIISDFYSIIKNKGDFYSNTTNPYAVLSKTLKFLFSETGTIMKKEVTFQDEKEAIVEFYIFRADLKQEIKVELLFIHNNYNWVLFDIKDLASLLSKLEDIEKARVESINEKIKENFSKVLVLKDFQKSDLNLKENSFLIRLSLENISPEDIISIKSKLLLKHKNQLIGSIDLNINDTISANNFYEKAWSIKLNDYKSLQNIATANSDGINAEIAIEEIIFDKGDILKLVK